MGQVQTSTRAAQNDLLASEYARETVRTAVAAEVAVLEPCPFVAVTRNRIRNVSSAAVTTYVVDIAPGMALHVLPVAPSHRSHAFA